LRYKPERGKEGFIFLGDDVGFPEYKERYWIYPDYMPIPGDLYPELTYQDSPKELVLVGRGEGRLWICRDKCGYLMASTTEPRRLPDDTFSFGKSDVGEEVLAVHRDMYPTLMYNNSPMMLW
jgi:hypothetical protein